MVDIDERVVSMKFDSSDFERKSKTTLSTLDQLNEKMSFKDAANSSNLNAVVDNVQKIADKAYTIVDRMIDKIKDNIANKLVNFLQENTIGQLAAGWSKYADMTTSVATLKAQGYAMEQITDQLERLNYFTDETSFEFTKMVSEIGKFTASGQSLEDATTAMMGIAEWAALSGKNAQEASRAMYQLSQALGAGQMRLIDWKSIQNLNMDTKEFRENAIEAAIAVGTLRDNLDGTYTTLVGKKAGSLTFNIREFADKLTEGAWFTTDVMMKVYSKYSNAVDEIHDIFEEKLFMDAKGESITVNTTAEAVREVKKNNEYLVSKFEDTELGQDEISKLLAKWKKVEKVTDEAVDDYATINKLTKEQARSEMNKNYAEYLKEYAEVFKNAEESAEDTLSEWQTYVSEYGIKAFNASQEAKTFTEAIESAKDAASTVWTTIYTNVFGNYDEARKLWTDLANNLYEIFVERLWDLNDVFEYWRSGGASALESTLKSYEKELKRLQTKSPTQAEIDRMRFLRGEIDRLSYELDKVFIDGRETTRTAVKAEIASFQEEIKEITSKDKIDTADEARIKELKEQIKSLNQQMEQSIFVDGRTRMLQGLYAFGAGFKSLITGFREGWDEVTEDNIGGKKLLSFSEKLRIDGLRFYSLMKNLAATSFFRNIAQGIKNLLSPITGLIRIIGSAIGQFLPQSKTFQDFLTDMSTRFKEVTEKIRPSEETLQRLARILRGIISVFRLIGKAALGVWNNIIKPIFDTLFGAGNSLFGSILEILADIADEFFNWEKGVDEMGALATVGTVLKSVLKGLFDIIGAIIKVVTTALAPIIRIVAGTIKDIADRIKKLVGKGGGNLLTAVADGFQNIANKAKNAWTSGESLADVFDKFKGGTGIGNFLNMLVAMFDNVVSRIGNVISAMIGLDDEMTKGKVGHAINNLKDLLYEVGTIIKWLYTNVVRPVLLLMFEGIAACMKDIGDAFKTGDILYILEVLLKSFKTIGALEIFKLIRAIAQVFGSGGLLKVIRNTAKTIKQIGRYFAAKTMNEISNSVLKFAVALGLLTGVLIALSYLPVEKFETIKTMLLGIGIAFTVLIALLTAMSIWGGGADNIWDFFKTDPIESAARMMWGMTAAILATIAAVYLLKKAFEDLWVKDENGKESLNVGGLVSLIAGTLGPIIAVITIMGILKKMFKAAEITKTISSIALVLLAMAGSIYMLALAMRTLTKVAGDKHNSGGAIVAAFVMLAALLAMITTVTVIIAKALSHSGISKTSKAGTSLAIAIVAMMVTTALIIMPLIEDLVQNADRFGDYMKAIGIFTLLILSIAASFALITVSAKGAGSILAAGLVFTAFTAVIALFLMPMLNEITKMNNSDALANVGVFAIFILSIAAAFRIVLGGITELITGILLMLSKFPKGTLVGIILSLGAVIAGIILLCHLFSDTGTELSAGAMVAVFGTVIAILLGFGVFAKMLASSVADHPTVTSDIVRILQNMALFFGVLTAGMLALVVSIQVFYKDSWGDALTILGAISLLLIGILAVSLIALSKAIESIGRSMKAMRNSNDVGQLTKILVATFIALGGMILLLTTSSVLLKLTYKDTTGYLGTITTIVVAALVAIGGILGEVGIFLAKVPNFEYDEDTFKIITVTMVALFAMVAEITAAALLLKNMYQDASALGDIASVVLGALGLIGGTLWFMGNFIRQFNGSGLSLDSTDLAVISIMMLSIIVIVGEISLLLVPKLEAIKDVDWKSIAAALGGVVLIIGVIALMTTKLAAITNQASIGSILTGIGALILTMFALSKILPDIFDAFNKFKGADAMDLVLALGAIIIPFYTLTKIIEGFALTGLGGAFLMTSAEIAAGIGLIALALWGLTEVGFLIKELFELGNAGAKSFEAGFDEGLGINSPSKEMKKDVKYIVQGLVSGMRQAANRRMVVNSSTGLATLVNESFCDTLGIASPSKVFYENGRFVVRGFINGMNDESNKNKQAGADMAQGFLDGLDTDKIKEELSGALDFDLDAEAEGAQMGEGLFDSFKKSLLGEDTELTEDEKKKLSEFEKSVDAELVKWEKEHKSEKGTREYEENRAKQRARIRNKLLENNEEVSKIIAKQNSINKTGSSGGLLDSITSLFSGSISDIFSGDSELSLGLTDGLESIGNKISGFFGDKDLFTGLKDAFTGEDGVVETIKEAVSDAIGEDNPIMDIIPDEETIQNLASNAGDTFGKSFIMALSNALTFGGTPIQEFLDFISGEGRAKQIYNENQALLSSFNNDYLSKNDTSGKYSTFTSLVSLALKENDNIALTMEDLVNIFQEYKKMIDSGVDVRGINLTQTLLHMANAKLSSYSFDTNDLLSHASGQYQRYISNQSYVNIDELVHNIQDYIKQDNINGIASNSAIINTLKNIPGEYALNLGNALHQIFRNEDATLYSKTQIYDENGPTGKYNVTLTRKGAYLVNKLIELARNKQLGANLTIDSVKALTGDYDQQAYEKIDAFAENYGDITGDHYEYTESQMDEILKELIAMNIIDEETGDYRAGDLANSPDVLNAWNNKLDQIRTRPDGSVPVTIVNDESKETKKTTYDFAKAMVTSGKENSGINYLNDLSNKARANDPTATQALMQMTNGLGYTGFMNAIQSEYDFINAFIASKEFYNLSANEQQGYRNKKAFYEKYYGLGQAKAQGLTDGEVDEMDKTQEDRNKTHQRDIDETKGVYLVNSPSRVYYDIGKFNVLGLQNGFMDTFEVFSKVSLNAIKGLTDASATAMQAMINSLDDDTIQPTITPVFDGNFVQNGVTAMNRSIGNLAPSVQATVNSFKDNTSNYNSRFDSLANAVYGTNSLINSFMRMVEEGELVNINVNAEADPNNIYELVVNTNRQKFKQTGKNPLSY